MSTASLPAPLVPAEVDLRDFPFTPIFRARLFGSTFHARASDSEWRAGVTLWLKSWDQVPAGTLPDDDIDLCRLAELGRDLKTWRKLRAGALHGWFKCADGRLHHKVVAEGVMEAWERKIAQRFKTEQARIKKANQRGAKLPMPLWEEFAAAHGIRGQQGNVPRDATGDVPKDTDDMSPGTNGACPPSTSPDVPVDVPHDVPRETASKRQRQGQRQGQEESTGVDKSSAGGPRAGAREEARPPAEDRDPGIPAAISTVRQGLTDAFERWFDLPDRPLTPADLELIEGWVASGTERGLSPSDTAAAAVAEVQRQFRRLDERGGGVPRSLRAVLDADVRTAIANARPARSGVAGPTTAAEVPAPYAGYLTATEYTSWIVPCMVQADDTSATIIAPTRPIRDWVSGQLTEKLRAALCVTELTVELAAPSHRPDHAAA